VHGVWACICKFMQAGGEVCLAVDVRRGEIRCCRDSRWEDDVDGACGMVQDAIGRRGPGPRQVALMTVKGHWGAGGCRNDHPCAVPARTWLGRGCNERGAREAAAAAVGGRVACVAGWG
jgi:hypothetical protein